MSESQAGGSAPRMTRRAQREAERAAEREAFLTGQQPLLTRREMKRLRDEAQALRDAVERGEITLEQAQALQNPLAPIPDVATVVPGHGVHSAATGVGDMEPIAVPVKGMSAASADSAASTVSAQSVVSADVAQAASLFDSPAGDGQSDDSQASVSDESAADSDSPGADSSEGAQADDLAVEAQRIVGIPVDEDRVLPGFDEVEGDPYAPAPGSADEMRSAQSPSGDGELVSADEEQGGEDADYAQAPSLFASGADAGQDGGDGSGEREQSDSHTDVPAADVDEDLELEATAPHAVIDESTPEPEVSGQDENDAPPRRRSLRDRFAQSRRPAPAMSSVTRGVESGDGAADDVMAFAEPSGEGATAPEAATDGEESAPPVRRPVVRIPTAAHGVRTVESTGELSQVQVVGEDFDGVETPQWKAVRPENSPVVPVPAPGLTPAAASPVASPAQAASPVASPATLTPEDDGEVDDADVTHAPIESSPLRTVLILFGIIVVGLLLGALLWIFLIQPDHSALGTVLLHIMACGEAAPSTLGLL